MRTINRSNLRETGTSNELGKGCFGKCLKMDYRAIIVAVKHFEDHVKASSVLSEASVLNQLDHPGEQQL